MEKQYYILKPGIVNKSNLLKYTKGMQEKADLKKLFTIKKVINGSNGNILSVEEPIFYKGEFLYNDCFLVHKNFIELAPLELVIAARLKGEI